MTDRSVLKRAFQITKVLQNTDEKVFHLLLVTVNSVNASVLKCSETHFVTLADIVFLNKSKHVCSFG